MKSDQRDWYVVAVDGHDANNHVDAWGPFIVPGDAEAFTIDLSMDNGWEQIEAIWATEEEVKSRTTDHNLYNPYKEKK